MQVGQVEVIALLQRVDKLVFKLVEVAARDDRDGDEAEQASERVDHARVQRGLARRERVIEIERDQARSGHAVCGYGRRCCRAAGWASMQPIQIQFTSCSWMDMFGPLPVELRVGEAVRVSRNNPLWPLHLVIQQLVFTGSPLLAK